MTYKSKRLLAGLLLIFNVATAANYYLNLSYLPRFAKLFMMSGVLMTLVYVFRFEPTREEMEGYRRNKRVKQQ